MRSRGHQADVETGILPETRIGRRSFRVADPPSISDRSHSMGASAAEQSLQSRGRHDLVGRPPRGYHRGGNRPAAIRRVEGVWRVVVIGVGYIGLEATENFREMGTAVTVVEALPEILPWLPETLRARVVDEAKAHGVEMLVGTRVEAIDRTGARAPPWRPPTRRSRPIWCWSRPAFDPSPSWHRLRGLRSAPPGRSRWTTTCEPPTSTSTRPATASTRAMPSPASRSGFRSRCVAIGRVSSPATTSSVINVRRLRSSARRCSSSSGSRPRAGLSSEEAEAAGFDTATTEIVGSNRAGY